MCKDVNKKIPMSKFNVEPDIHVFELGRTMFLWDELRA